MYLNYASELKLELFMNASTKFATITIREIDGVHFFDSNTRLYLLTELAKFFIVTTAPVIYQPNQACSDVTAVTSGGNLQHPH